MYNVSNFEIIKQQLADLQDEILSLDTQGKQIPELIEKTNLLRENELLKKLVEKQSLLLEFYKSYIEILEELLSKYNTPKVKNRKPSKTKKRKKASSSKEKTTRKKTNKQKTSIKRRTKKKSKSI